MHLHSKVTQSLLPNTLLGTGTREMPAHASRVRKCCSIESIREEDKIMLTTKRREMGATLPEVTTAIPTTYKHEAVRVSAYCGLGFDMQYLQVISLPAIDVARNWPSL